MQAKLEAVAAMAVKEAGVRLRVCRVSGSTLVAIAIAVAFMVSATAFGATITVGSLSDTAAPHICTLRDAISSANLKTRTNGCIAGTGSDIINFSVAGRIALASDLPEVTDSKLTITGPALPGIAIYGGGSLQVMQIAASANVSLSNLTIVHASSTSPGPVGGAIQNLGKLSVTNSVFRENQASLSGNGGGAISNDGSLDVINSTFADNSSELGGAIHNKGSLTVVNSTFSSNSSSDDGGAIYNNGTLDVTNSTFAGNNCDAYGGGIATSGSLAVASSTFSGNSSGAQGGGIYLGGGPMTITNSTFAGNVGGGATVAVGGLDVMIVNSTFSSNVGTGVQVVRHGVTIKNTILANNSGGSCSGVIFDHGYNIADDSSCGFSATGSLNDTDPMLDPSGLQKNGGPTETIGLLSGSPAIDVIPLAACANQASPPSPAIADQRGFPRPDDNESNCDSGAYEVQDADAPFSAFAGTMTIASSTGTLDMASRFKLGPGASIDPTTQLVGLSVGNYAVRLPVGSFVKNSAGYLYHGTINGVFLRAFIKSTAAPRVYSLILGSSVGSSLTGNIQTPVTLTIGDNFGSALMFATVK